MFSVHDVSRIHKEQTSQDHAHCRSSTALLTVKHHMNRHVCTVSWWRSHHSGRVCAGGAKDNTAGQVLSRQEVGKCVETGQRWSLANGQWHAHIFHAKAFVPQLRVHLLRREHTDDSIGVTRAQSQVHSCL